MQATRYAFPLVALIAAVFLIPAVAAADDFEKMTAEEQRLWQAYARTCGRYYVETKGRFYALSTYSPAATSRRVMERRSGATSSKSKTVAIGVREIYANGRLIGRKKVTATIRTELPPAEVRARKLALGPPKVGEFGFIVSAVIDRVIDDHSVMLRDVQVVDAKQLREDFEEAKRGASSWASKESSRMRKIARSARATRTDIPSMRDLTRYDEEMTDWRFEGRLAAARDGEAWQGVRLRVEGIDTHASKLEALSRESREGLSPYAPGKKWPHADLKLAIVKRREGMLVAIPADVLRRPGITPQQFDQMLKQRELTRAGFAGTAYKALNAEKPLANRAATIIREMESPTDF